MRSASISRIVEPSPQVLISSIKNCRCDKCGAWSYDKLEGICYIHSVNACCGQKTKQIDDSNFVSGYRCPRCSSTKDKCPCSLEELVRGPVGCASAAFSNNDGKPEYTNPTVSQSC